MGDDTEEFEHIDTGAPWEYPVNRDTVEDDEYDEPEPHVKVPEPAVIRGVLVSVIGLIGYVVGKQIDVQIVDQLMDVYVVAAPLVLAWWIRRNVTPVKK